MNDKQLTPENQKTIAFGVGLAFFVCVLIGLFSLGWWLSEVFIERERSPVNSIVIMGEMPYTQRTEVLESMSNIDLGNFFQVDVNEIQSQVSKLPWVYSVAVRKQWPNEVRIYVVDQTPIALWNGDFILNKFGKAFQAEQKAIKQTLPQFFGPEGSELLALQNFNNLNDLLEYRDLAIDELILGERFSWQLTLNNGIRLNLGREERVKRVQRFMDVYPLINEHLLEQNKSKKELKQAVDYIDLRYDTGLAVGWKEKDDLSSSISVDKQQRKSRIGMLKKHVLQESMVPIYKFRDDLFSRNKLHTEELTLNV
ncbi:cell division protein FtsQ/DivIB [Colwellia sp. 6_MG-2023]|uniref:cell division protein FtsQ/DivIB n=1 Tax=Colwellia sp. 6_MG-2023 TaxID=3062676 RepID=UPI0026E44A50|nr:cell division protein FtsQ/DivIB [Colwellia sp. 6_MG-2023]MDO6487291.1 cell division protein FtsQ/DivIB [Colwellia sp. 6_MG-2023]